MSSAFVKEEEAEWLHDVPPTTHALIAYLTRENNNVRVYEKKISVDSRSGRELHEMSNGLSYTKDDDHKWIIVW